jgi:mono/diheme cytochrome c family protein
MVRNLLVTLAALAVLASPLAASADDGKALYEKNCVKCHSADGSGMKDGKPHPMVKMLKLEKDDALSLLTDSAKAADSKKITLEGKGKMKGLKVTEAEAAAIAEYVKTLQAAKK